MREYRKTIQTEEIKGLPIYTFDGEITVVDRMDQVDSAVADLSSGEVVGFDTETRPSFKKGVIHSVGLMQLANDRKVYLFRLNKYGLPPALRRLLADESVLKVGVGIRDDLKALRRIVDFAPAAFLDLQLFAKAFGIEELSFSKMMSIIFGVKISKRQRTSNWDAPKLTPSQIRYAATDAWGALKMYHALKEETGGL